MTQFQADGGTNKYSHVGQGPTHKSEKLNRPKDLTDKATNQELTSISDIFVD